MIKEKLKKDFTEAAESLTRQKFKELNLSRPQNPKHGDYSTNWALKQLGKVNKNLKKEEQFKTPFSLAESMACSFPKKSYLKKVEAVEPGFINFHLSPEIFISFLQKTAEEKTKYPDFHLGPQKKLMVEFAHPNTHKLFHIGHLRNIFLGEALSKIFEATGNKVIRANYQGDVGLHIAKCLYAILKTKNYEKKLNDLQTIQEKAEFLARMYVKGNVLYKKDEKTKKEIIDTNRKIYEKDPEILPLWKRTRKWSLDYFDKIYNRLGVNYDRFYFEGEVYERGLEISKKALRKNILEKSRGAIIFKGDEYGLDTRVFITTKGLPTYEAKELGLAELEFSEFGALDKCIHVVAPEQKSFFQVTFKVEELLNPEKYKEKQYHLTYGYVQLKKGKMSSREGRVVEGSRLLDEIKEKIKKEFKVEDKKAEKIAIGATRYSMLKISPARNMVFDVEESISLEGNSGPYLQYGFVRAQSILKKAGGFQKLQNKNYNLDKEELALAKKLYESTEVVKKSAQSYNPSLICNYLFDLAQNFNSFYEKNPVIKAKSKEKKILRLNMVKAYAQVVKSGLQLLGIETLKKM